MVTTPVVDRPGGERRVELRGQAATPDRAQEPSHHSEESVHVGEARLHPGAEVGHLSPA